MGMTRHFVDAVIRDKGWQPYIGGHWIDFGRQRGGVIITFKDHEQHEYKCSHKVAEEIIKQSQANSSKGG